MTRAGLGGRQLVEQARSTATTCAPIAARKSSTPASVCSGDGKAFTGRIVLELRRSHGFPSHHERLRARGLLTLREFAEQLSVHPTTINARCCAGDSHKANNKNIRLFDPPTPGDPRLVERQGRRLDQRKPIQPCAGGAL